MAYGLYLITFVFRQSKYRYARLFAILVCATPTMKTLKIGSGIDASFD